MRVCPNCTGEHQNPDWSCPSCGWLPASKGGIPLFAPQFEAENAGFKAEYFPVLAARETGHFWFEARNRVLQWAMRRYAPDARNYLEIGCGTGFVLSGMATAFPQLSLSASEIFTAGLQFARQRVPQAEFLQLDARELPFDREFDVLGAFDVIEHIEEDEAVMASAHRALRPGGKLLLTVPQHRWLWSAADDYAHHKRRYTRAEMVGKLERAGFRCLKVTSFISLLLPVLWLSRMAERKTDTAHFDAGKEFEISPVVNGALRRILAAERALIRLGISFPAGGSLLVVAQKQERL